MDNSNLPIWISPTAMENFITCEQRLQFKFDPEVSSLDRMGTKAAVGLVVHGAIELMMSGQTFDIAWQEALSAVQNKMSADWAPAIVPKPENWDAYFLSKARIRARSDSGEFNLNISKSVKARNHSREPLRTDRSFEKYSEPLPWIERTLYDPEFALKGTPDQVVEVSGELTVIDHKTGLNQSQPSARQIRQLQFYAWLVMANLGRMPTRGEIRTSNNDCFPIKIDLAHVKEVIELAKRTRVAMLSIAQKNELRMRPNVSDQNCAWCAFRPVCDAFLSSVTPEWRSSGVVRGRVVGVEVQNTKYVVELEIFEPTWHAKEFRISNVSLASAPIVGARMAFADFTMRGNSAYANWNTLIHVDS